MADRVEEKAPEMTGHNPFQLIAYLLFRVRHSLEDEEEAGRAPRWVRIARARATQGESDVIGKVVKEGVNGFAAALSYMLELSLDLKELLVQMDAGKALIEVSLELINATLSEAFQKGVRTLVGQPPGGDTLKGTRGVIASINDYMNYIPEPEDLEGIGHELYRLLCIEQDPVPAKDDGGVDETQITAETSEHLVIPNTGKVRLMQWAFGEDIITYGLGPISNPESDQYPLARMGSRRLWQTANANLPKSTIVNGSGDGAPETLVEFFFDNQETDETKRQKDLVEVHALLEKLGYIQDLAITENQRKQFTAKLSRALRRFQNTNGLLISGMLDNATINRLMHLDFEGKNLMRAKPYDGVDPDDNVTGGMLPLVNHDADHWADEGLELKYDPPGYPYYIAGREPSGAGPVPLPKTGGWISDNKNDAVPGFVALQSRIIIIKRQEGKEPEYWFHGGQFSEGEAESPGMFFAARLTKPWIGGRSGPPGPTALFGRPLLATGTIHRLYQWIHLGNLKERVPSGYELYIQASAMIRSLWSDRNRESKLSDQGRIAIELYKDDVFKGDLGTWREPSKLKESQRSDWFPPNAQMVEEERKHDEIKQRRNWRRIGTEIKVYSKVEGNESLDVAAAVIALEGRHQSGWDTDAYFDDVIVTYEIRKPKSG